MFEPSSDRYSSRVRLLLFANGRRIQLSQIGPGFVMPKEPTHLTPCVGRIVVTIDDEGYQCDVRLLEGAVPFEESIRVTKIEGTEECFNLIDEKYMQQQLFS